MVHAVRIQPFSIRDLKSFWLSRITYGCLHYFSQNYAIIEFCSKDHPWTLWTLGPSLMKTILQKRIICSTFPYTITWGKVLRKYRLQLQIARCSTQLFNLMIIICFHCTGLTKQYFLINKSVDIFIGCCKEWAD